MKLFELEEKAKNGGLTVEEVIEYQKLVKPVQHVYGKYGSLKKRYLEEHNWTKAVALGEDLPEYLHGVDRAAEELYDTMYEKLSKDERYRRTGDYLEDLKRENTIKQIIEETILAEIVYEEETV